MNATLAIVRTQVQSARNVLRDDARMKVALCVMLALDIGLALWSVPRLQASMRQWQLEGVMNQYLFLSCLFTWVGIALFTVVGNVQRMLGSDEAQVEFMLPLVAATRFRAIYISALLGGLWNWMVLEATVSGVILVPLLGWYALMWIALLEIGALVAVLSALLATLFVIRYLFAGRLWTAWLWIGLIAGIVCIEILLVLFLPSHHLLINDYWLHPEDYIIIFGLVLLFALGPLAGMLGKLYMQAFLVTQRWDRSRRVFTLPWIRLLVNTLATRRTLMSAFLTKMVLNQSRNPFAWLRLGMLVVALALFPILHRLALHAGWSNMLCIAVYSAVLGVLPVAEQAPCAISGEANRLTLYLTMPLDLSKLLRAKLTQFMLPALSIALLANLVYSWQLHETWYELLIAAIASCVLVIGMLTVMVWGSAWDEDVNLAVEGALQTIMQEEGPMTPRRMGIFNAGLAVFVGMVVALWKVPMMVALPMLVVVDLGLILGPPSMTPLSSPPPPPRPGSITFRFIC